MTILKKGSKQAKDRMAKLRAMRKPKKRRTTGKSISFKTKSGKKVSFKAKR